MSSTAGKIKVMQAHENGKEIEVRSRRSMDGRLVSASDWDWRLVSAPDWDWWNYEYRVKAISKVKAQRAIVAAALRWAKESPVDSCGYTRYQSLDQRVDAIKLYETVKRYRDYTVKRYRDYV